MYIHPCHCTFLVCLQNSTLSYAKREDLTIDFRFIMDSYELEFTDSLKGSNAVLSLEPSSMGFSVIKFTLAQENSTVLSVCSTVSGASELEVHMWQKDPWGIFDPTLIVLQNVCFVR